MISQTQNRRGISAIVATFALALALTGCGGGPDNGEPPREGGGGGGTRDTGSPKDSGPKDSGRIPTLTEEFVVGTWGDPDDADDPYLEFAEDGTVTGSDGCNDLAGTWTIEEEAIVFSELATTLVQCAGVNTWLSAAATAVVEPDDDDELAFLNGEGVPIGTLDRDGPDYDDDRDDD